MMLEIDPSLLMASFTMNTSDDMPESHRHITVTFAVCEFQGICSFLGHLYGNVLGATKENVMEDFLKTNSR